MYEVNENMKASDPVYQEGAHQSSLALYKQLRSRRPFNEAEMLQLYEWMRVTSTAVMTGAHFKCSCLSAQMAFHLTRDKIRDKCCNGMILNDLIALSTRYMSSFYLDQCHLIRSFRFPVSPEFPTSRASYFRSFRFRVTSRHSTISTSLSFGTICQMSIPPTWLGSGFLNRTSCIDHMSSSSKWDSRNFKLFKWCVSTLLLLTL